MPKTLVLKPRLSEKAYAASEATNTYVFDIPDYVNRQSVARAVASQYEVGVKSVKITKTAPKPLRSYRKRSRGIAAVRAGIRKAYVTLNEGDRLPVFAAAEKDSKETK